MPSPRSVTRTPEMKTLDRIAHEALQFGTLYHSPLHRVNEYTAPAARESPLKVTSLPASETSPRYITPASPTAALNRAAHELLQFGSLYIVPSRTLFPGHSPRKVTSTVTVDRSDLNELNRLAKLVELSSASRCPQPDLYPKYTPRYDLTVRRNQLHLLTKLRMLGDFASAFPKTSPPKVTFFSGQPRIEPTLFNSMLKSKLSQTRSVLGLTSTPVGAPALICSHLNKLLSSLVKTKAPKRTANVRPQNARRTQLSFVPASQPELAPPPPVVPGSTSVVEPTPIPGVPEPIEYSIAPIVGQYPMITVFPPPPVSSFSSYDVRSLRDHLEDLELYLDLRKDLPDQFSSLASVDTSAPDLRRTLHPVFERFVLALFTLAPSLDIPTDSQLATFFSQGILTNPSPEKFLASKTILFRVISSKLRF
jgi:hypothetical protein